MYVLNVTYPLVDEEVSQFCSGKRAVLIIEEGQPDYLEQNLNSILRKADIPTKVHGKDVLPMAGEYTAAVVTRGITQFVEKYAPHLLQGRSATVSCQAEAAFDSADFAEGGPFAAAFVLHRLPRAADFYRDETGGA